MSLKREFSAALEWRGDEPLLMEMTDDLGLKLKQNHGLLRSHIHNQPRPNYNHRPPSTYRWEGQRPSRAVHPPS